MTTATIPAPTPSELHRKVKRTPRSQDTLRLRAAVPFYGHADFTLEQLRGIRCPVLAFYGERDTSLIDGLPALTQAMGDTSVDFRPHVYPACGHAFFNDTNPFAYNADAAALAWPATLDFLAEALT